MAFDIEGYRKAAKDAGLSDSDIQKDIDEETKGIAAKGADADMANVKVGKDILGIPEWLQPATALAGAAALGGLGLKGAQKLKERMTAPEVAASPRVEPTFGIPDIGEAPQAQAQPQSKFTPPQGDVTDVASRSVGDPRLQIGGPRALPAPEVAVPNAPAPTPPSPTAPIPEAPVAPPAAAPAPVPPKPLTEIEQLRLEKAKFDLEAARAKEARATEIHASRLAADAQRAEAKKQKTTASGGVNPQDRQMLNSSENAKIDKAMDASQRAAAPKPAPVVPPAAPAAPALPVATAPVATAPPAVPPAPAPAAAPAIEGAVAPKAAPATKWPGGAEGSAVQLFGGTKKNFTPESQAALTLFKEQVGGPLTMPATGGSINQIEQASKFYEKYTGQPLPRSPEGKLTRIPEEQIQKLNAGIRTELEDAVKGNKLGSLGKGAMAAAALLGLTTAVQAAQKGDFGPLRQAGFDIGGPVALGKLGIAALSRAAGSGFAAATYAGDAGEANEAAQVAKKFADAQKLGSPFRSVPPKK